MANYSKFIKLLLSFVIAISPILLINNANAAVGGWTMSNPIAQGASTVYNGTKNVLVNGKNVVKKGVATVTPTATNVAKVLARGAGGLALSVAVEQLIGAVDWVLDPVNNQIKWIVNPEKEPCTTQCAAYQTLWYGNGTTVKYATYKAAAPAACLKFNGGVATGKYSIANSSTVYAECKKGSDVRYATILSVVNPAYDPTAEKEGEQQKTMPLEVVAAQVISNAESNTDKRAAAQVATTAAAADVVAEAEKDNTKARPIVNQLEASAETPTDETATGETTATDPTTGETTKTGDLKLAFPVFCGWAPVVCEAAQVVIKFPTTVTEWWETANTKADAWSTSISEAWTAAKEWATSEPSQDNTQVDVENNNTQEIDTQVSFSSQCPANIKLADFSYHGISQSWDVDFSKFCDVFATYLRPVVISIGAFSAVLIVSGVGVRENG